MLEIRMASPAVVRITGIDLAAHGKRWYRTRATLLARDCVQYIAWLWGQGKMGDGLELKPNSAQYTAMKIRRGLDPRRGIRSRNLWRYIQRSRVNLFTISPVMQGRGKTGTITITFRSDRVHAAISYLKYYMNLKAQRRKLILRLNNSTLLAAAGTWLSMTRAEIALALMSKQGLIAGDILRDQQRQTDDMLRREAAKQQRRLGRLTNSQKRMIRSMLRVRLP